MKMNKLNFLSIISKYIFAKIYFSTMNKMNDYMNDDYYPDMTTLENRKSIISKNLSEYNRDPRIKLPKGSILFRSDIDVCLKDLNVKSFDAEIGMMGLYFSNSILICLGISFEYFALFSSQKLRFNYKGQHLMKKAKHNFVNHQIGKFITTEDIYFYNERYDSEMATEIGEDPRWYNFIHEDINILYGEDEPEEVKNLFNIGNGNEYFIGLDSDLKKLQLLSVYEVNVDKVREHIKFKTIEFNYNLNDIYDYFTNYYELYLTNIDCKKDGKKRRKKKSRNRI